MNTATSTPAVSPNLAIIDGRPVTTSLNVAEVFGKQHQHVLRAIDRLEVPDDFAASNFGRGSYLDAQNQPRPMYQITRDGFTLLAMGFTGKAAMRFKLAYIAAFNAMEAELLEQAAGGSRKSVDLNYYRRTLSPSGLDIRYTLDLTKIILRPTLQSMAIIERLTGVSILDLKELAVSGGGFKEEVDYIGQFLEACTISAPGSRCGATKLYEAFKIWYRQAVNDNKRFTPSQRAFGSKLNDRGEFRTNKVNGRTYYHGLALTNEHPQSVLTPTNQEVQA